jgi:hypothetical protein
MRTSLVLGLIIATLAVGGCGKHDLRLVLEPGDVRIISQESERTIHVEGKEGDAQHRHLVKYRLEVQRRTGDTATIKVTIEDMNTEMDLPKSWGVGGRTEAAIAILARGHSFTIDLNRDGKVTRVEGAEKVVESIVNSLNKPGEKVESLRTVVMQQFSKESIQELFTNTFAYVPETKVGVGDSWQDTQVHTTGMPFQSHVTYTLRAIEDGVAEIDYDATIEAHYTKSTIALGLRYAFSGSENGSLRIEADSGWVTFGEGELKLESRTESTVTDIMAQDRILGEQK